MRDWIFVKDHVKILYKLYSNGKVGETYNIGSNNVLSNISILRKLLKIYNQSKTNKNLKFDDVIDYVEDRKGHDFRYAISTKKIDKLKLFKNKKKFLDNLLLTFKWYKKNSYK